MSEYTLVDGTVVTDEDLTREAEEFETETWEGGLKDLKVGRPLMFEEEMAQVGFKEPLSMIAAIDERAKQLGVSRSDYLRSLVANDLAEAGLVRVAS